MRRVAIAPVVGILLAALTSTIGASGVNGAYTCSSSSSCLSANQSAPAGATGAAIKGAATNSYGVRGVSTNSAGTLGQSAAGSAMYPGVEGESTNNNGADVAGGFGLTALGGGTAPAYGVYALGSKTAVYGQTTANGTSVSGTAVSGIDLTNSSRVSYNTGIRGLSSYGTAVLAEAGTNDSYSHSYQGGIALAAFNSNSDGISALFENPLDRLFVLDGADYLLSDTSGAFAVDFMGDETLGGSLSTKALSVGTTDSNGDIQVVQTNYSGYILDGSYEASGASSSSGFNFSNAGDETLTGTLNAAMVMTSKGSYARTRGASGVEKIAYGTRSTAPAIDDVGDGQLIQGSAYVRLDSDLADIIDQRLKYHVFITPEGESNQLYVTQKSPSGFVVREAHGGRSNIAFDYRIVAKPFDEDGRRLAVAPIQKPFTPSAKSFNRFAPPFANPATFAARHRNVRHSLSTSSPSLDPFEQLRARLGPAKFEAELAEFKRQQRR